MPCCVCLEAPSSVLFLPCKHLRVCSTCVAALRVCPICREPILESIETLIETVDENFGPVLLTKPSQVEIASEVSFPSPKETVLALCDGVAKPTEAEIRAKKLEETLSLARTLVAWGRKNILDSVVIEDADSVWDIFKLDGAFPPEEEVKYWRLLKVNYGPMCRQLHPDTSKDGVHKDLLTEAFKYLVPAYEYGRSLLQEWLLPPPRKLCIAFLKRRNGERMLKLSWSKSTQAMCSSIVSFSGEVWGRGS